MADVHRFGSCCTDLAQALSEPPNSCFHIGDNGVLYLAIGYVPTPAGPGWVDQVVLFCPFCGARLQTRKETQRAAQP